jgi:uncharacterized membrane protein
MRHLCLVLVGAGTIASAGTVAQQAPRVQTIHLGTVQMGEDVDVIATDINSSGRVAGTIYSDDAEDNRSWAFTWTPQDGIRIIVPFAQVTDINDRGVVVGIRNPCGDDPDGACAWIGFVWSSSAGTLDLGNRWPAAINNAGTIVGQYEPVGSPAAGFVRAGGTFRDLPGFVATDVNERGVLAGMHLRDFIGHAAVWASSFGVRELDANSPGFSRPSSISDSGFVVGEQSTVAMIWTPFGGASALADPSAANAISNRGWIVGHNNERPALWLVGRRLVNLPTPSGATGGTAHDVNESGQIVGVYTTAQDRHAVVWIVR